VECSWAIRLSYFDSGASYFFALSSIMTNIQHTVNKPLSFDDLLGYRLPRVGLQSIDRGEEEGTVGGTVSPQKHGYRPRSEDAGISMKDQQVVIHS
jgi:hypothetical protein